MLWNSEFFLRVSAKTETQEINLYSRLNNCRGKKNEF